MFGTCYERTTLIVGKVVAISKKTLKHGKEIRLDSSIILNTSWLHSCVVVLRHFILFRLSTLCEPIYCVLLKHGLTLSMNPMAEVVRVGLVFIWLFNYGPMAFLRKKPQFLSLLTEPENQSKFRCYTYPQKSHKLYM